MPKTRECEEYLYIDSTRSDRSADEVEVHRNGDRPNWYGRLAFTSSTLPHHVGQDGSPVPQVVVGALRAVRGGMDLRSEAWDEHGTGHWDVGKVCVPL